VANASKKNLAEVREMRGVRRDVRRLVIQQMKSSRLRGAQKLGQ